MAVTIRKRDLGREILEGLESLKRKRTSEEVWPLTASTATVTADAGGTGQHHKDVVAQEHGVHVVIESESTKRKGLHMSENESAWGVPTKGDKHDQGKDRWDLLPWGAVRGIVKVLGYGAKKYGAHNWKHVPDAKDRYFAALQRHLTAWYYDFQDNDPESGLHHLWHAGCCLLFLIWHNVTEAKP